MLQGVNIGAGSAPAKLSSNVLISNSQEAASSATGIVDLLA
jgi:hypothetical protein